MLTFLRALPPRSAPQANRRIRAVDASVAA
jgi:hypothetical protein